MPSLKESVQQFFRDLIPTKVVTRFDRRSSHASIAHTLSVDDVHDIFRAAEGGDTTRLFALYRDILLAHSHLQAQCSTRKLAVLGEAVTVQPFDKKRPEDVAAKDALWPITNHPDWATACNHLLDSVLWPVAVVEKVYKPSTMPGLTYELARLVPVPHDLLDFSAGRLRIRNTDDAGRPLGTFHDADTHRYIVHRGHLLTTADNWGGPMRSLVFWWLLGTMDRGWWAQFLDRYGAPFTVAKYEDGDDDSRSVLMSALSLATKLGGLVVTRETDVELKQAAASDSGDAFDRFRTACNDEISKLILGQTTSADAKATGLGSGVGDSQASVRQDIKAYDARTLGATFTTQLAAQFLRINGLKGAAPLFMWGSWAPEKLKAMGDFLTSLKTGGMRVADEGIEILSDRAGLPLEREPAAPAGVANPFAPFSVKAFSAALAAQRGPGDEIAREAAATLSQSLGSHFAPIRQIILDSATPDAAIRDVQAYCARLDTRAAAAVIEEVLIAYAANGSVANAR